MLVKLLIAGLLLLTVTPARPARPLASQGICIPKLLRVTALCGQMVFPGTKGEEPVLEGSVELREDRDNGVTIAKAIVDSSGCFNFSQLKAGKYVFLARSTGLHQLVVRVQLIKPSQAGENRCLIVVALGVNVLDPCGGGYARVADSGGACDSTRRSKS